MTAIADFNVPTNIDVPNEARTNESKMLKTFQTKSKSAFMSRMPHQ